MQRGTTFHTIYTYIYKLTTNPSLLIASAWLLWLSNTGYNSFCYYLCVKVFNMLPSYIKTEFDNPKKFKAVLQKFLHENSFYSLEEYFELLKS